MPEITDAELTAELAPLAAVIHQALTTTPLRLGEQPADLVAQITLAVAAHLGPLVGDIPDQLARLRAELAVAKAAGYRNAADNVAEQIQLHGHDADAEMLLVFLKRGAELREQHAANQATTSTS